MAAAAGFTSQGFRAQVVESLEDSVSTDLMTMAVTLIPCGHVFNEDTVKNIFNRNRLCPHDRTYIQRYIPNYTVRDLANMASTHPEERVQPREDELTAEASTHFAEAKAMGNQGNYEGAILALLATLQLSPHSLKAQAYLEFCLNHTLEASPPVSLQIEGEKEKYTALLLKLMENPQIQDDLKAILEAALDKLMNSEELQLSPQEKIHYNWTQKLIGEDRKVVSFVAGKLRAIHGQATTSHPVVPSAPPQHIAHAAPTSIQELLKSFLSLLDNPSIQTSDLVAPVKEKIRSLLSKNGQDILSPTDLELYNCVQNLLSSTGDIRSVVQNRLLQLMSIQTPQQPSLAFGALKWQQYFGVDVIEPPLPAGIDAILQGPCPFFLGKKVGDTHFLTLIPEGMTLERLETLVRSARQGNQIGIRDKDDTTWAQHGKLPVAATHWILMTNDVIPNSRNKNWADQQALAANYRSQGYEPPSLIEVATALLLEYVQTGRRFYSDSPLTWTRCVDQYTPDLPECPMVVGGFSSEGLDVNYSLSGGGVSEISGIGLIRRF